MDQEREVRRRANELLRSHGPMSPVELLRLLEIDDLDEAVDLDPASLWRLLLVDPADLAAHAAPADPAAPADLADTTDPVAPGDPGPAFPLSDGRLCDLAHLLEGLTLTHLIDPDERDANTVGVAPDLSGLHLASDDGRTIPLAAAHEPLTLTEGADGLTGPPGWLPDEDVLVARLVEGRVEVTGLATPPANDPTTARRLADTLAALHAAHDQPVDEVELLIEARARYPRLLASPQAPLSELLATEGLVALHAGVMGVEEAAELGDPEEGLAEHLREDHGLDDEQVHAVLRIQTDVLRLQHDVLRASVDRLRALQDGEEFPDAASEAEQQQEQLAAALESLDLDALAAQLAVALADTGAAMALVEDVLGDDQIAAACLVALLTHARPSDRSRRLRANDAWVRARALELVADDHADAERELRRARELDEDHGPATYDLARYLSDRGQAGAALGLAQRVEGPGVEELIEVLTPYTKPGPHAAGRNEPCPCGSGRKHKACCARHNGWPLSERMPWLMHKLMGFYSSPYASDVVLDVARACGIEEGAGYRDTAALNLALFDGGIVDDLCELRGSLLPADELERLRAWSHTRAEAYELVEAGDDGTCVLLDLRSGERTTLVDHSLAGSLGVGAAILAWLVEGDEHPVPFYGLVTIPDRRRAELLDLLDEEPSVTRLGRWLRDLYAPPRLTTTTGDALVSVEQVYEVADAEAARAALAARLEQDDDGTLHAFEDRDGQRWLKGSVTIEDDHLTVTTMSVPRAAWFADLIAEVLPDATLVDEQRLPATDLTARRDADDAGPFDDPFDDPFGEPGDPFGEPGDEDPFLDPEALPPEARAELEEHLAAFMAEQEDAWVDTPLPALGGATPRQAVDDPTRRDDLLRLLDEFQRNAETWEGPGRGMDAGRLRTLLGLD